MSLSDIYGYVRKREGTFKYYLLLVYNTVGRHVNKSLSLYLYATLHDVQA